MRKFLTLIALSLLAVPSLSNAAAAFPIAIVSSTHTTTSFKISYRYTEHPHGAHDVYAWVGDWATSPSQWNRNTLLTHFNATTAVPINFSAEFNYAQLGLVSGKTYGYVLADRNATLDAQLFGVPGEDPFRCFTVGSGSVPCPSQSSGTGGAGGTGQGTGAAGGTSSDTCFNPGCQIDFTVTLVNAPATTAELQVEAASDSGIVANTSVDLYVGTSQTNLSFVKNIYSGMITSAGAGMSGTLQNLLPQTQYYFQFKETVTHSVSPIYSFTTSTFGNQAGQTGSGTQGSSSSGAGNNFNYGNQPDQNSSTQNPTNTGTQSGATQDHGTLNSNKLQNPFMSLNTFPEIFAALYNNILIPVAIPFLVIAIMYSGFLFVVSRKEGKTYKLDQAKSVFKYTMIGAALILGGWVIANALQSTFCDIAGKCAPTTPTTQDTSGTNSGSTASGGGFLGTMTNTALSTAILGALGSSDIDQTQTVAQAMAAYGYTAATSLSEVLADIDTQYLSVAQSALSATGLSGTTTLGQAMSQFGIASTDTLVVAAGKIHM